MKRVKLEYDHAVTITDEAFEQISSIVQNNVLCETCQRQYTDTRPQVARNRCLPCFLRFHQSNPLRSVGVLTSESDTPVHGFLDSVGYMNPSTSTDEVQSLKQSNRSTLNYYGYPVPLTLLLEGETEERSLIAAAGLDMIVIRRLMEHMTTPQTEDEFKDFATHEDELVKEASEKLVGIERDIEATKALVQRLETQASLGGFTDLELKQKAEDSYRSAKAELLRLETRKKDTAQVALEDEERRSYKMLMQEDGLLLNVQNISVTASGW